MRLRRTGAIRDSLLSIGKADLLTMTETRNQCESFQPTRAATGGAKGRVCRFFFFFFVNTGHRSLIIL